MGSKTSTTSSISSQRTNQRFSGANQSFSGEVVGGSGASHHAQESVSGDLAYRINRQRHRRDSSYSSGRKGEALFYKSGASSSAPSISGSHQSNDSWQDDYRPREPRPRERLPRVRWPSVDPAAAKARSYRAQKQSDGHQRSRQSYSRADPASSRHTSPAHHSDRGRHSLGIGSISSSIERLPSLEPSDSVSRSGSRQRSPENAYYPERTHGDPPRPTYDYFQPRHHEEDHYEDDLDSRRSYTTESSVTRNMRYPQHGPCPLGYTRKGPFWT